MGQFNSHIFSNNFFTSIRLLSEIRKINIRGTATPLHKVSQYSQIKKRIRVSQSDNIHIYNQNMCGIDRSDQNGSLYRISTRDKSGISA
ncbi:hypothetical protein PR048_011397 [Dryococelus australis]|uniref:PiggyBac transposable element-derived protein domain-containing protein n=1 Tax=Dryococelus australis TaxID=614101 RepID=A0ABQ9HM89_9NEOP|nr:hypothetical protein PR048_011397 [Dryococelus australis]